MPLFIFLIHWAQKFMDLRPLTFLPHLISISLLLLHQSFSQNQSWMTIHVGFSVFCGHSSSSQSIAIVITFQNSLEHYPFFTGIKWVQRLVMIWNLAFQSCGLLWLWFPWLLIIVCEFWIVFRFRLLPRLGFRLNSDDWFGLLGLGFRGFLSYWVGFGITRLVWFCLFYWNCIFFLLVLSLP